MSDETSIGIFEMGGTMTLAVDNRQPPWRPFGQSVGAAAVDDVVPTIVIARRSGKDGSLSYVLKVHHLSTARKRALADAFLQATERLRSSTTEDDRSFEDDGFEIDITAALRESPKPRSK